MASFGKDAGLQFSIDKIIGNIKKFDKGFRESARQLVEATTREIQKQAKLRFVGKRKNGIGDVRDGFGLHPHRLTGTLSRSIVRSNVEESDVAVEQSVFVGNQVEAYAVAVELGTRRSRPHPFLKPAGEVSRKTFQEGAQQIARALAR